MKFVCVELVLFHFNQYKDESDLNPLIGIVITNFEVWCRVLTTIYYKKYFIYWLSEKYDKWLLYKIGCKNSHEINPKIHTKLTNKHLFLQIYIYTTESIESLLLYHFVLIWLLSMVDFKHASKLI